MGLMSRDDRLWVNVNRGQFKFRWAEKLREIKAPLQIFEEQQIRLKTSIIDWHFRQTINYQLLVFFLPFLAYLMFTSFVFFSFLNQSRWEWVSPRSPLLHRQPRSHAGSRWPSPWTWAAGGSAPWHSRGFSANLINWQQIVRGTYTHTLYIISRSMIVATSTSPPGRPCNAPSPWLWS